MVNATGWSELMTGNIIQAPFDMFNASLLNWFLPIIFIIFIVVLFIKTRSTTLCWTMTTMFLAAIYAPGINALRYMTVSGGITIIVVDVIFLAVILMKLVIQRKSDN